MFKRVITALTIAVISSLWNSSAFAAQPLGPATWGTPDQPWGHRRNVTDADRRAIASYRKSDKAPVFFSNFQNPQEFKSSWQIVSDDKKGLRASRRPISVKLIDQRLKLTTCATPGEQMPWCTGYIISNFKQKYGFFEARMKIADISGVNNAFWLNTADKHEIDIAEVRYPNYLHLNLCNWDESAKPNHTVGFGIKFADDFSKDYHDFGLLWTPKDMVFEVDGEPLAAVLTSDSIADPADIRLSTALVDWAGNLPANPVGHGMMVKSIRVFPFQSPFLLPINDEQLKH